jgi:acetoin utilization deacetylase AcuC-like enzyme
MSRTGFLTAPVFLRHDTGPGHPERPERLTAILQELERSGLGAELDCAEATAADPRWIGLVHAEEHARSLRRTIEGGGRRIDPDTTVSSASFEAALTAVGAALAAGDRVLKGSWRRAFCALRPPGHHAEHARAMGFCLFNNVAILARYLQREHGLERVAIVDFDVHHGNGTQHLFESDPSIFYASLHQWPHYPGTGAAEEHGLGPGEGATLNCAMPAGSGDADWLRALETRVLPALEDFRPQALLLSAGFDAHAADPLSGTRLSAEGYGEITRDLVGLAESACGGRVVSLLEGGYDLEALGSSVLAHLAALHS